MTEVDPWTVDPSLRAPSEPIPDARDLWVLVKQIDELAGEWTFPIFLHRVFNFHTAGKTPMFYEPIGSFELLGLEALLEQKANAYCPSPQSGDLGVTLNVFPSIFSAAGSTIPMPVDGQEPIGKHFMAVIGVHDEDTVVVRNSWSGWRRKNFAFLTRKYFEDHGEEGMIAREWEFGPTETTVEQLLQCQDQQEFARLWRRRRRYGSGSQMHSIPHVQLKWYGCWSFQSQAPAEVLMVHLEGQVAVGTAIIVHRSDNLTTELSDLFIWPAYRGNGYGLLLERFAAERARLAGSIKVAVYLWNSDAVKGRQRALRFLRAASYSDIEEFTDRQFVAYAQRSI